VSFVFILHSQYYQFPNNNDYTTKEVSSIIKDETSIEFFESELLEPNSSIPAKAVFVIKAKGYGLGNHLFAYAEAYALSRRLRLPLIIPAAPKVQEENSINFTHREYVLDQFKFPKGIYVAPEEIGKKDIHGLSCQMGKNISLIPSNVTNTKHYYKIGGFCLGYDIFQEYGKQLQQIQVKVDTPSESYVRWKELISFTEWPIAVHVRKRDIEKQYYSAPAEYFHTALRRMKEEIPRGFQKRVFVFSDDIGWAQQNIIAEGFFPIELEFPIFFVSGSFGGLTNVEEMDLMIKCKSIVISNSTFSWWAAFIMKDSGKHKKVVIRPQFNATKHANDPLALNGKKPRNYGIPYPKEWISIDT